jgi:DNA polymerase III delta subunit
VTQAATPPVLRALLEGDPPPAFVLSGDASGLAELLAERWLERLKSDGCTAELSHMTTLDMERESVTFAWRTPSFFVSRRLFVLPDLADLKKGPRDEIAAYLKEPAPHVVLFIPSSKKDAISSIKGVKAVNLRTDQVESAMAAFACGVIRKAGISIDTPSAAFLARWIGPDFPRFKEEIAKLLATVGKGKAIGEEEIRGICVASGYDMDPFQFAEALIARDRMKVVTMFRKFSKVAEKDEYYKLLGAVSWKVRASGGKLSATWAAALIEALAAIDRGLKGESELSPEQVVEIRLLKLLG